MGTGDEKGSGRSGRHLSDLQTDNGLEKTSAIVGARELRVLQHLLCDLSIELGTCVAQVAFHIDELLNLVKLAVHLKYRHL